MRNFVKPPNCNLTVEFRASSEEKAKKKRLTAQSSTVALIFEERDTKLSLARSEKRKSEVELSKRVFKGINYDSFGNNNDDVGDRNCSDECYQKAFSFVDVKS